MLTNSSSAPLQGGFDTLNLISPICRAVHEEKYTIPTPIQTQAIPHLVQGRDLLGCAQTGTGKTAAFALPILQRLAERKTAPGRKGVRALILTPTRELAGQIGESFRIYGRYLKINHTVIYGGVGSNPQIRALSRGVDILVATPGRLLDLFNQGHLRMDKVEVFVLDEADRMLDMGFLPDVRKIHSAIPSVQQSMLFSATLPDEILHLTKKFLTDPVKVTVTPSASTVEKIDQRILFVDRENKSALLESVLQDETIQRVLIFTRTKHRANRIAKSLSKIRIRTEAIHGNKSQSARLLALKNFRSGKARVLVATDVASRGLDIDGITHIINYELPNEPESYVHRIGRTARAGASGVAISFCDAGERGFLRDIERTINQSVTVVADHPFHSPAVASQGHSFKPSNGDKGNGRSANNRNSAKRPARKTGNSSYSRGRPAGKAGKINTGFRRRPRNTR